MRFRAAQRACMRAAGHEPKDLTVPQDDHARRAPRSSHGAQLSHRPRERAHGVVRRRRRDDCVRCGARRGRSSRIQAGLPRLRNQSRPPNTARRRASHSRGLPLASRAFGSARIATVAVLLPLAVPIAAGASPAATRCMSLATYARTLVTARTRSVAASSRGRACVRRDAVCGQSAPPRLSRIDAAVHTARGTCETEASPAAELLASAPTLCRPAEARRPLRQG